MDTFHNNIKVIRKMKNIKRQELADSLNISYSALSKYESGERNPDVRMLSEIAKELSVTLEDLIRAPELKVQENGFRYGDDVSYIAEIVSVLNDLSPDEQKIILMIAERFRKSKE